MFCSKCGKTLMPEDAKCPYCGTPMGESRFEGGGYTSVQAHILPDSPAGRAAAYTRTTYTTMTDEEKQEGAVDSRTTYRPVFDGSAPEEVRKDMRAALDTAAAEAEEAPEEPEKPQVSLEDLPEEALNTLSAVDEELQMEQVDTSELHSRPIESTGRAGISAGVEEYVQKLEYTQQRKGGRRRRGMPEENYDTPAAEEAPRRPRPARPTRAPQAESYEEPAADPYDIPGDTVGDAPAPEAQDVPAEDVFDAPAPRPARLRKPAARPAPAAKAAEPQDVYDAPAQDGYDQPEEEYYDDPEANYDDGEFEEIRYGRGIGVMDILKVALIMVLAAALIVGGVLWFRNFRTRQPSAPIEGVTDTLYDQGLAKVKSFTEDSYINELVNLYRTGNSVTDFMSRIAADSASLDKLMPEEPAVNDSLFVSALQSVQTNIGNAILMDALEADQGGADNSEASAARWNIVNTSISQLEAASTAQELTAILNGEQITAAAPATPSPTPAPTYARLVKDDKSDAVKELQNRLYVLGFLLDDRDGTFGNKTQTAVKAFQQAAGLPVTGIADSETQALLYSEDAPRTKYAQVTPKPKKKK